jgi:hypothetical protein
VTTISAQIFPQSTTHVPCTIHVQRIKLLSAKLLLFFIFIEHERGNHKFTVHTMPSLLTLAIINSCVNMSCTELLPHADCNRFTDLWFVHIKKYKLALRNTNFIFHNNVHRGLTMKWKVKISLHKIRCENRWMPPINGNLNHWVTASVV